MDSHDHDHRDGVWEASSGLENLMMSVSGKEASSSGGGGGGTVGHLGESSSASSASSTGEVTPPPSVFTMAPPQAQGTLSVKSVSSAKLNEQEEAETAASAAADEAGAAVAAASKMIGKPMIKKAGVAAKKIGARKLDSNPSDVRLESFESVEKRATKAAQEEEDHKLANKMQGLDVGGTGSSRLSAVYQEAESIYRPSSVTTSSSNYSSSRGGSSSGNNNSSSFKGASAVSSMGESFQAREKYGSAKGISSDQFFGRDEEDTTIMRSRLEKYSNSSAISSDMLSGEGGGAEYERTRTGSGTSSGDSGLGKLKDSVRDFFDSVQSRLG